MQAKLDSDNITGVKLLVADMEDAAALKRAASDVSSITGGKLDHLIVNGAYLTDTWHLYPSEYTGKEEKLKSEVVRSVEINLLGNMYAINAFLPLIRAGNVKKIVSISSGHADLDLILDGHVAVSAIYSAIKAATNVMIAKYAAEYRSQGVKFLSLSPGYVNTDQAAGELLISSLEYIADMKQQLKNKSHEVRRWEHNLLNCTRIGKVPWSLKRVSRDRKRSLMH